ncbi:hypothetical protein G7Z17_g1326 [Cylindrodendrum hubeiense]|uniref:Glucan 1,3-beta-glucosidase n=1 Tax=Cylindrodendrum hubeiense TaxID=595255 RepID=A0A9P5LK85_9HYPO|nr:hypothetical protein G7Z17_g1326 [Cylindrodendrum hubeiense]
MARANHAIISNPLPNRFEVLNSTELSKARKPPPLLDYSGNTTASSLRGRGDDVSNGNGTERDMRYTVPDELIEAARLLSENWDPSDEDLGGYDAAAAVVDLQTRFKYNVNDTNMMPPMLQYGSGLNAPVQEPPSAFRYSDNTSEPVETTHEDQSDGKADDTDAINKAISSGGRCGGGTCTGSTIYPATVYFPPGTYKVSSSIIQYYNTEIIGNPLELPTILAAPSFVGLGVISSNSRYLNQNNFLRSVRNMIVDIRPTPAKAEICGIHWQVAQGTSLENVHFYMVKPKDDPTTTQQGIYMENGSGGFLSDLYFVGGKFGAYMGNQQFTASGLFFQDAATAIQIHWDWGWTMQDIVVDNCDVGFTIVGGAGGPMSTGQGIGSLLMTDLRMHYVKVGISTSVMSDNSTALLLSNSGFYNVDTIVRDATKNKVLIAGGSGTKNIGTWGFGRVTYANGTTTFLNGAALEAPVRDSSLVTGGRKQFFTRRRPMYDDLGKSQVIDVKANGARGDGVSDDAAVLNHLFSAAANMSAVVYLPFGVYLIKDTVEIPVGSRIIGQAWPQIMAAGPKFQNALKPHVAVRVGQPGQAGVIEVQSVMFTVKGATAGAVMMEWNVHETSQGSAGLWDAHFRVGGAAGTGLTVKDCPKLTGKVNNNCIAASLMMHLTPQSSAYLENVWMWTADHDFDTPDQAQIDVYVGRGLLIESKGPTWLWGTSVEHCVLYQYQLTGAENIVMGLIQTESPYFQSVPTAPAPFKPGAFPDDPAFHDCSASSKTCGVSWAVRIIDSSAIHILSAGLYSFFSRYDQACINSGRHDCQAKIFYTEQSFDVWVYNLVTLGSLEMISPLNGAPTLGKPNRNGFASSILAWLGGAKQVTGKRDFVGYKVHTENTIGLSVFPDTCKNALTALVRCDNNTRGWKRAEYHGIMPKEIDVNSVCDVGCAQSISDWLKAVDTYCAGLEWEDGTAPGILGSFISYGINETCQTDKKSGRYCNDIIAGFSDIESLKDMPKNELCSDCYINRLKMMQASPYSIYQKTPYYQEALKAAVSGCSMGSQPTAAKDSPFPEITKEAGLCLSNVKHTTLSSDTCDSLALKYGVSSAAIFSGNPDILDCNDVVAGVSVCLPLQCKTYKLKATDGCADIEVATGENRETIRGLNPWIEVGCGNLQAASQTLGSVICISAPGGEYEQEGTKDDANPAYSEYAPEVVKPPSGAVLADNTNTKCGKWHKVSKGDDCAQILARYHVSLGTFVLANPSISIHNCTGDLVTGRTYCVNPTPNFLARGAEIPQHWRFGCYASKVTTSDHPVLDMDKISHESLMTLLACKVYCRSQNADVFGLEDGNTCMCDTRLLMDSQLLDDAKCQTKCNGNSSDSCGGYKAVEVYSLNPTLRVESESLGCFVQDASQRIVLGGERVERKDMGLQECGSLCTTSGNAYFSLGEGTVCTCGQEMASPAKSVDMKECGVECGDGLGDTCGGKGRVEVFSTRTEKTKRAPRWEPPVPVYEHFGCYNTAKSGVPGLSYSLTEDKRGMTIEYCAKYCLVEQGQWLFGLEGTVCRCGWQLDAGTEGRPEADCAAPCAGDSTQACGGEGLLNIFGLYGRPLSYSYAGCYSRDPGRTPWGVAPHSKEVWDLSARWCARKCTDKFEGSKVIFSLDGGNRCTCALSSAEELLGAVTTEADCNIPCTGNPDGWCGGETAGNVYRVWP